MRVTQPGGWVQPTVQVVPNCTQLGAPPSGVSQVARFVRS
jgi:hypothetical protein